MIEEQAYITRIEHDAIYVQSSPASACKSCAQKASCSTNIYAKILPKREIALRSQLELSEGDTVIVGIEASHLLRASLLIYLLPLLVMLCVAGFLNASDAVTALVTLISLFITLFFINKIQHYFLHYFMQPPEIIRKC